jgi:hypothetical protein
VTYITKNHNLELYTIYVCVCVCVCVCDKVCLRQVCGFLWVLRFPPPIKLIATI